MEQRGPMVTQTDHLQRQRPRHCLHQILKLDHLVKTIGVDEQVLADGADLANLFRGLRGHRVESYNLPIGQIINQPSGNQMDMNQFATRF